MWTNQQLGQGLLQLLGRLDGQAQSAQAAQGSGGFQIEEHRPVGLVVDRGSLFDEHVHEFDDVQQQ
jgi:hypothetical protein